MDIPKVAEGEYRFCLILWEHEPVKSSELVRLCKERLGWKETTTYTVLKKLCVRGILEMKDSVVTVLIDREAFYAIRSEEFVEQNFSGSLPAFVAAFTTRKKPTPKEMEEIRKLMDSFTEESK